MSRLRLVISSGACGAGTVASASQDANGNNLPGGQTACFSAPNGVDTSGFPLGANGKTAGAAVPDGVPDGFANPVRNYKAVELEMNKSFSRNWLMDSIIVGRVCAATMKAHSAMTMDKLTRASARFLISARAS